MLLAQFVLAAKIACFALSANSDGTESRQKKRRAILTNGSFFPNTYE